MVVKITSRNRITIPKRIIDQMPKVRYFDIELEDGTVKLKPLRTYNVDLDQIRFKMKKLGLKQDSVAQAIKWARSN